jgi:hypothetical protein
MGFVKSCVVVGGILDVFLIIAFSVCIYPRASNIDMASCGVFSAFEAVTLLLLFYGLYKSRSDYLLPHMILQAVNIAIMLFILAIVAGVVAADSDILNFILIQYKIHGTMLGVCIGVLAFATCFKIWFCYMILRAFQSIE